MKKKWGYWLTGIVVAAVGIVAAKVVPRFYESTTLKLTFFGVGVVLAFVGLGIIMFGMKRTAK